MKKILLRLLLLLSPLLVLAGCETTNKKEKEIESIKDPGVEKEGEFKKTCNSLLESIIKKDTAGFNALIQPGQGFYLLFRTGAMDEYKRMEKMLDEFPLRFEFIDIVQADIEKDNMQYSEAPTYDCEKSQEDEDGWSKRGFFADTVKKYSPVNTVIDFREKYMEEKISEAELNQIKSMENNSRQVVFTGSTGEGIIFYLKYIDGKWWLSVINRLPTDCSA